jgi:hypothetical protein
MRKGREEIGQALRVIAVVKTGQAGSTASRQQCARGGSQ